MNKKEIGTEAETHALALLSEAGLRPVSRNYSCRGGEIDLVMRDDKTLVFVEVRYRKNTDFGGALDSVDSRKRRRLLLAAQHYLQHHRWQGPCRFDVVGFDNSLEQPQWVRDAFPA